MERSQRLISFSKKYKQNTLPDKNILLLFVVFYMIITVFIGWWASRFVKNTNDFVMAGRRMPMSVVAAGLFATWFGSETVMGASTAFLNEGLMGIIEDPFGAALCLIFIGIFMAKPLYRLNLYTFSDYFRRRYSPRAEMLSAVMMIPSYWGWIAAQLIALSTILNILTGVPIFTGVIMSTASGAILAPSTVIGENIVKPFYPNLTDKQLLYIMRLGVVFITVVSIFFATLDKSIYELVRQSSELSLVSLFVPLIAGLYWKKASAWGAMAAMIMGLLVWLLMTNIETDYPAIIYGLSASIGGMIVFSILENKRRGATDAPV